MGDLCIANVIVSEVKSGSEMELSGVSDTMRTDVGAPTTRYAKENLPDQSE
jgi:hypothetical protein